MPKGAATRAELRAILARIEKLERGQESTKRRLREIRRDADEVRAVVRGDVDLWEHDFPIEFGSLVPRERFPLPTDSAAPSSSLSDGSSGAPRSRSFFTLVREWFRDPFTLPAWPRV